MLMSIEGHRVKVEGQAEPLYLSPRNQPTETMGNMTSFYNICYICSFIVITFILLHLLPSFHNIQSTFYKLHIISILKNHILLLIIYLLERSESCCKWDLETMMNGWTDGWRDKQTEHMDANTLSTQGCHSLQIGAEIQPHS